MMNTNHACTHTHTHARAHARTCLFPIASCHLIAVTPALVVSSCSLLVWPCQAVLAMKKLSPLNELYKTKNTTQAHKEVTDISAACFLGDVPGEGVNESGE